MKSDVTFFSLFWGIIAVACGMLLALPLTDLKAYRVKKAAISQCYESAKGSPDAIKKCADVEKMQ